MSVRLKMLVMVLATALLAGCGFQLRGKAEIPPQMRQLELVMPEGRSELRLELERTLRDNGIELVAGSPYRLQILSEKQGRRVETLTAQAKVDEYALRTEVRFQVEHGNKLLIPPRAARAERVYTYNTDRVTAKDEEEVMLRHEMQRDIANQILRQYEAAAER